MTIQASEVAAARGAAADSGGYTLASFAERRKTADRIFRGALVFNCALTVFWLVLTLTGRSTIFFQRYDGGWAGVARVLQGVLFFYVVWGFIWYGVKAALLKYAAGFTTDERRQAFSSRMRAPFALEDLLARHSERRIRIIDMIGRRGRFITLGLAAFFYLYSQVKANPSPNFAGAFLQDNLFDAVLTSWIFLGFYYADNFLAAAFYGPQSRIMDGVLARANCLLITTLWTLFKFVMLPIGTALADEFAPRQFAVVFALIWGSYIVTDALAEIGGSVFGRQNIKVWGIGDINRKSVAGTLTGFLGAVMFCTWVVLANGLGGPWLGLALVIAISNTLLELFSPRGTDDFTMATGNALLCLAFGRLVV